MNTTTTFKIRATDLQHYIECPRRFKYAAVWQLVPKRTDPKLWIGQHVHEGLRAYYCALRDGATPQDAKDAAVAAYDKSVESDFARIAATFVVYPELEAELENGAGVGRRLVAGFADWAAERDSEMFAEILEVEREFEVPILNPRTSQSTGLVHMGRFDLIVRDRMGRIRVVDHKTCSSFPSAKYLRLNMQFYAYDLAAGYLWPKEQVGPVVINALRKGGKTTQPAFVRYEVLHELREVCNWMWRFHELAESIWCCIAFMAVNEFEPRPSPLCEWRCRYTSLCLAEEDGSDINWLIESEFVKKEGTDDGDSTGE